MDWLRVDKKGQEMRSVTNSAWVWDENCDQYVPKWFEGKRS